MHMDFDGPKEEADSPMVHGAQHIDDILLVSKSVSAQGAKTSALVPHSGHPGGNAGV